jgi:transporter family-2 protein
MYSALAPLAGVLITLMNAINSRFAGLAGYLVSTLVIHLVGLAAISILLFARREESKPGRLPFYYYLGGVIGVGTVFACNYAFATLSASLAVALALLGQTFFSIAVDSTGFLGRKRYPITARTLPGVALAIAGMALIAGDWRSGALAMLVGLVSGILPSLSFILNSELGLKKGVFRSTRVNYLTGLTTTLVIVAALRPPMANAARSVAEAGPLLAFGGGLMGVAMVALTNFLFPHIPAFSATLLMFSGQALTGTLIDYFTAGAFDARKFAGTLVLLSGLVLNALLSRRREYA